MPDFTHFDLGIAGGGIIGLCAAVSAARKGASVLVVDESRPFAAATPASAGVIWPLEALPEGSPFWPWVHRGIPAYPAFIESLEGVDAHALEFATHGFFRISAQPDDLRPGEQWVEAGELEAVPAHAGGWVADAMRISPAKFQLALLHAAAALGVVVVEGTLESLPEDTHWQTTAGSFQCERSVLATGAWQLPEVTAMGTLEPVRGQMLELELAKPWQGPMLQDGDSYMVPVSPQCVILGSTVEQVDFDAAPTAQGREQILQEAKRILDLLGQYQVSSQWAGLRPRIHGGQRPVIGQLAQAPRVACALGLFRLGVTTAPAIGEALACWALDDAELPPVG